MPAAWHYSINNYRQKKQQQRTNTKTNWSRAPTFNALEHGHYIARFGYIVNFLSKHTVFLTPKKWVQINADVKRLA